MLKKTLATGVVVSILPTAAIAFKPPLGCIDEARIEQNQIVIVVPEDEANSKIEQCILQNIARNSEMPAVIEHTGSLAEAQIALEHLAANIAVIDSKEAEGAHTLHVLGSAVWPVGHAASSETRTIDRDWSQLAHLTVSEIGGSYSGEERFRSQLQALSAWALDSRDKPNEEQHFALYEVECR